MSGQIQIKERKKWSDVFCEPEEEKGRDISPELLGKYGDILSDAVRLLQSEMNRVRDYCVSPFSSGTGKELAGFDEPAFFTELADQIPSKLASLNLFVRPFRKYCRTCLITDVEIEKLAWSDHKHYCRKMISAGWKYGKKLDVGSKTDPSLGAFNMLPPKKRRYFKEINHSIPVMLKKTGLEIFRKEEISVIDERLIKKLARAIHSRYLFELKKELAEHLENHEDSVFSRGYDVNNKNLPQFDDLPDDIRFSNLDNAFHIPAKLLAIGFRIRPVKKGYRTFTLHLNNNEIETIAMLEHIRWCWDKRLNGWVYGTRKDVDGRRHPDLVPYEQLPEASKEIDRDLVKTIPALLQDIEYEVYPVNPGHLRKLSYAIKPQSVIHRILNETRELNEQIRKLVSLTPEVENMVSIRNRKIEEAIVEIEGNYNYASYIQETFLPDDLFIRECFPDSFVLFKPKDIVSGDFYFFSRQDNYVVFAAADCTGHGIPAALLSTIGYGILDQAVNELKMIYPPDILNHLYVKLHRFLRRDEECTGISDDLDIALCSLDKETNRLCFSAVANPVFIIRDKKLIECRAGSIIDGLDPTPAASFVPERIDLKAGDVIYLFSDGYADQFGGRCHKKYSTGRFKSLLLEIQEYPMPEQSDRLYEEIENWREENKEDQTDDILVIGIRV